jgi:hypothetical protein
LSTFGSNNKATTKASASKNTLSTQKLGLSI